MILAIKPNNKNKNYFKKLNNLSHLDLEKMTMIEFMNKNKDDFEVLTSYYLFDWNNFKINLLLFVIISFVIQFLVPFSDYFNPLNNQLNPGLNLLLSIGLTMLFYLISAVKSYILFLIDLKKIGEDGIVEKIILEIKDSPNLFRFYYLRFFPDYLVLFFNTSVDWITASNLFED